MHAFFINVLLEFVIFYSFKEVKGLIVTGVHKYVGLFLNQPGLSLFLIVLYGLWILVEQRNECLFSLNLDFLSVLSLHH